MRQQITFKVSGMNCGRCAAKVENAVKSLPQVEGASVDLASSSVFVEGNFDTNQVVTVIESLGYSVDSSRPA